MLLDHHVTADRGYLVSGLRVRSSKPGR
jgi:hypothetical protein